MDSLHNGWFSEIQHDLWPGQCFSLKVKNVLHEEKSNYQQIQILETETYGRCLLLDGIIQCTSRDEFSYQEMIAFLPLCCHPNPKKVLIIGGGDGGVARDVAKHPSVEEIHQVEVDERVVEVSKLYLPEMACGFKNSKLKLIIGDGYEYMKNHKNEFDVIITDSSDPIGPATNLFTENYFKLMKAALRKSGILCSQAGSFWLGVDSIKKLMASCRLHLTNVAYAVTSIPSYPCGHIGFVIASNDDNIDLKNPVTKFNSNQLDGMNLKYYSSAIHSAAFTLPHWINKALYDE